MDNLFQRQNIPMPVKMVAAAYLLLAVLNVAYSFFFFSISPVAPLAIFKALVGIAAAIGLLRLRSGWRTFSLVISLMSVLVLPFYFLGVLLSPDFLLFVSTMSGVDSVAVIEFAVVLGFAMFLWICITLMRPDVKTAFESKQQKNFAT
jgi:hypothetical protein